MSRAHLLKVTGAPVLASGIASKTSCKCCIQQAAPYPITFKQCQKHIQNLHFNPFVGSAAVVAA
ncbi:hypothetical protein [Methylomonas rivi]|uniref:Secreted protein n=1 Tax=Methylomonas rivi TaxID=2952226 RepID=A0ABT1U394_9GAMM|nr:hypothetical protein [Methylomonas sp. WSC-6]MCQ8128310.1 hypothetical protein [Methylomonas sp. WSC-6]